METTTEMIPIEFHCSTGLSDIDFSVISADESHSPF
jgi:hypothetical protein